MQEPMLRAWMLDSVRPAPWYADRAGRWVAETNWPPDTIPRRFSLTGSGLLESHQAPVRVMV
ncbi:MAG: hypothetical protein ACREF3_02195, partial [Acetobacteraceae bacterium]